MATNGQRVQLSCPAHDDSTPSLSVVPGDTQPVVFTCHANCKPEDILAAAGLTWADVSNEVKKRDTKPLWTPAGTATNLYPYYTADGSLSYEVLRVYENGKKRFFQRQPDPDAPSGYRWNLDGVDRLLYRLPQVLESKEGGATIWVAEGEKCVEALLKVIPDGDEATCNSGGAGKFLPQFAEVLAGANVVICADSDDAGREHARQVREMCVAEGCEVRILEAPPGVTPDGTHIKDVADHLYAGRGLETLLETTPGSHAERARSAVDWQDILSRPEHEFQFVIPNTLARSERLLIVGLEGHGKSVILRQIATCVASGLDPFTLNPITPRRVLMIDAENHPGQIVSDWKKMNFLIEHNGGTPTPGMLMILEEWDSTIDLISPRGRTWLKERVHAYRPDLLCLGPLKNLVQRNLSDHESVHQLRTTINEARTISECAVVMEHHAPLRMSGDKERELRPYGSGLFLGWPDFGYAMKPTENEGVYQWQQFRGDRVRGRQWPEALRWGKGVEMPWTPTMLEIEE